MNNISKLLLITIFSLSLFSCGNKNRIDNPALIKDLQVQVDDVVSQGYQIVSIYVYTENFSEHGPDDVGHLKFMFIKAASPDLTIEYLANFSYSGESKELNFLGYPTGGLGNKRENKTYSSKPDLSAAISKLDEIKKQIPENYEYDNLLFLKYTVKDDQPVYEFNVELKTDSKEISHPKVKKEELSHTEYSTSKSRKKFGTTQTVTHKDVQKKTQHTITFKLIGDQIEIQ